MGGGEWGRGEWWGELRHDRDRGKWRCEWGNGEWKGEWKSEWKGEWRGEWGKDEWKGKLKRLGMNGRVTSGR